MRVTLIRGSIKGGERRRELSRRILFAALGQEEAIIIDIASPAAKLAALVVTKRMPVGLVGKPMQGRNRGWRSQHDGA